MRWEQPSMSILEISYENIVKYRPLDKQRLDEHLPAETDSCQTARC
jgi:hypothetical protein